MAMKKAAKKTTKTNAEKKAPRRVVQRSANGRGGDAWARRLRSPQLRREIEAILRDELRAAAAQPVRVLLPPARAHQLIRDFATDALSGEALGEIVLQVRHDLEKQLRATRRTTAQLLGHDLARDIEKVLDEDILPEEVGEELISHILRQEFVRKLLTEVVHTSIVSFYKRVNPLFGGLATSMLEDQIRGFIAMFMPMIQEQAVRFATGRRSQAFARELGRSIVVHTLATPLADLAPPLTAAQRKRADQIIRNAAASAPLRQRSQDVAIAVWDSVYAAIRDRKVREIVDLERLAPLLVGGGAELVAEVLARPGLAALLRRELGAPASPPRSAATKATRPAHRKR